MDRVHRPFPQGQALEDLLAERRSQDQQWGDQSQHPDWLWFLILIEEAGEVAKSILHSMFGGKEAGTEYAELTQMTAVGLAWLEAMLQRRASD